MNGVSLRFRFLLTTLMEAAPNRGLTYYSIANPTGLAEYQLRFKLLLVPSGFVASFE